MTSTVVPPTAAPTRPRLASFGPNWATSVMGTSVLATATATLPVQVPGQRVLAVGVWLLAGLVLLAVGTATALHWHRHPAAARGHLDDPVMAHSWGAPPMALLAFGAATLLVGRDVVGLPAALVLDVVLWSVGTVGGLVTLVLVPLRTRTRHATDSRSPSAGWLVPVVPPMVSAATGALLVPHAPDVLALPLLLACYAFVLVSLTASAVVLTLVARRTVRHGLPAAGAVPVLWVVLGPLGQSITAVHTLGGQAPRVLPATVADRLGALTLGFGLPVWTLALAWAAFAATVTIRAARHGIPFSLAWWSFVFPVGTVVTGTSGLAEQTGSAALTVAAVLAWLVLATAWATVAARTAAGVGSGRLLH
ncbi:TDT family transporter [Modestobacter sp. Leaf380]|uniref:TDT family transporter n=1 Tax=Modestobacter sp. Leaf380 TaxID=1736356 RepID=UPI0006FFDD19|nr:TDT family transporter [Modestobacter sp. Leaf380]KQS64987.1 hypothetical protein ASG41_16315 [Modestobacter sp. Leaf380]